MTTGIEQEAANILPSLLNIAASAGPPAIPAQIVQGAIAVTVASTIQDLSSLSALDKGRFITLHADGGDVYYALNNANSGTIDPTATGFGVTVCQRIPSGQSVSFRIPPVDKPGTTGKYQYLLHRTAAGTATLRVAISSVPPGEDVRALQP